MTATSSGDCIDPGWLRPGCLVLDVGVPSDIRRATPARDDVLILSAGYARVPAAMPRDSFFLRFYHGIVPSCLGETMVLALENRAVSFSIGRDLSLDRVREIGRLAEAHGFALLGGAGVRPVAESRGPIPVPQGALENPTRAVRRSRPPCRCRRIRPASIGSMPRRSTSPSLAEHAAERHARHINPVLIGVGGPSGLARTFVRGEGAELFDESGRAYLDFVAGFGSLNLGHNHPEVAAAVASALSQQAPGFSPGSVNPLAAALAEQLVAITPRGLEIVFFTNSGAESIEAALKLARAATGRSGLLSCLGSFHGKTFGALSVTGNRTYQSPFGPHGPRLPGDPLWRHEGPRAGTGHAPARRVRCRADPGRRRNGHPSAGVPGRGPPALPRGWHALHRRRGADRPGAGPGRCSPSSAKASSPTS